jgi:hypothetical protein
VSWGAKSELGEAKQKARPERGGELVVAAEQSKREVTRGRRGSGS